MYPDYTISRSSLCNKLHPVGPLPHWFLFVISKAGNGENKEFNTTHHLFFIEGGFIEGVAYWVFRLTPGISFYHYQLLPWVNKDSLVEVGRSQRISHLRVVLCSKFNPSLTVTQVCAFSGCVSMYVFEPRISLHYQTQAQSTTGSVSLPDIDSVYHWM